ncbi:16S rRNA (guanine(527)-N(7))-methyltransferase RsmG [Roseobacter sp. HKCCA0434]|uniref:16S rRNA (guanine(527)-N(7))-methyltransferase RsmG n=1 Tax=Roseobacter sp. HKCCA0434 TaxID=3079297 RepID=UPI002905B0D2|nr:16S rRNA (guanine(527)-N(7))-methyltransferase RsmG [Roseobacter sp. HKCCA0434]
MKSDTRIADVSRETRDKLAVYERLLKTWSAKINLVAPNTLANLQSRHFEDSAQLLDLANDGGHWVDLGSGGGFPGLILALIDPTRRYTLVESDLRKSLFLKEVARETDTVVEVINNRIERIKPLNADILSARALAPLDRLLTFAERHGNSKTQLIFPKGRSYREELANAQRSWDLSYEIHPSRTSDDSVIITIDRAIHV